jgi:hypothetical protein
LERLRIRCIESIDSSEIFAHWTKGFKAIQISGFKGLEKHLKMIHPVEYGVVEERIEPGFDKL